MTVDDLKAELEALLADDLGRIRRKAAIAIVPPEIDNGDVRGSGIAVAIQRVPEGERQPSRSGQYGAALDQWYRRWIFSVINFENSSVSSQSLNHVKAKIEAAYRGRLIGGQGKYMPPSALNKEQCQFEIFDPELVEAV